MRRLIWLDHALARAANAGAHRWPTLAGATAAAATRLAAVQVGLMGVCALSGRFREASRMLLSVAIVYALVEAGGSMWGRRRPFERLQPVRELVTHPPHRSFPSRHVASAVAMAMLASPARPRLARAMWLVAALLGLSRVGAGLHYPSDVLAGAMLGTLVGRVLRHA